MGFVFLLVVPAVLMGIAISVIPRLSPILHMSSRRKLVLGTSLLFLIGFLIVLVMPDHVRWDTMYNIGTFGPIPLTGIAGFLIQSGLRDSLRVSWWRIGASSALFALACVLLYDSASLGHLGPVFALLTMLSATSVAIVTGVWMVYSLPSWRKLAAVLIGVVLPVVFSVSIWMGENQSPEDVTQKNGNTIIYALEQCYVESGEYPTELSELVPAYLTELPPTLTTQGTGWLYTSDTNQYTLGYWHYPHKLGVILCLYSSESADWQCESAFHSQDWEPFSPVWTPVPEP